MLGIPAYVGYKTWKDYAGDQKADPYIQPFGEGIGMSPEEMDQHRLFGGRSRGELNINLRAAPGTSVDVESVPLGVRVHMTPNSGRMLGHI